MVKHQNGYEFPTDRAYDRDHHMWVQYDPTSGYVRVGIDALGLVSLGDLAYVVLYEPGTYVRRGEAMGTLEAAKMTGEVMAPVSGTIVARNERAMRDPGIVNAAPYGDGWLVLIRPDAWENESAALVTETELPAWLAVEVERYRERGWLD
jgi:glycine cleavage system H protein